MCTVGCYPNLNHTFQKLHPCPPQQAILRSPIIQNPPYCFTNTRNQKLKNLHCFYLCYSLQSFVSNQRKKNPHNITLGTFSFSICIWAANTLKKCLFLQKPQLTLRVRGKKIKKWISKGLSLVLGENPLYFDENCVTVVPLNEIQSAKSEFPIFRMNCLTA